MKNTTRMAAAILATALIAGTAACGTASQTDTTPTAQPTTSSSTAPATATPKPSATPSVSSSAADASATAAASAEPSQQDLQAIVDDLEAMEYVDSYNDKGLTDSDPVRTPLMQAYDAAYEDLHPQNAPWEWDYKLALDGTWAAITPRVDNGTTITLDASALSFMPDRYYSAILRHINAPDGVGAPTTGGQWAHREWDGYQAIWKSTGTNYWLYIRQI